MADGTSAPASIQDYLSRRLGEAKKERQSFITHWKDISDNIQPRRGRWETTDRNKGERRHNLIIKANNVIQQVAQHATLTTALLWSWRKVVVKISEAVVGLQNSAAPFVLTDKLIARR